MTKTMKEHPILFSAPMVRAILESRKTQTRRIIKKQPNIDTQTGDWLFTYSNGNQEVYPIEQWIDIQVKLHCPFGKIGDKLWVRETFANLNADFPDVAPYYVYRADEADHGPVTWKPSIHMPKIAARLWLEVINVRIEKLQDISESDAISEGIEPLFSEADIKAMPELEIITEFGSRSMPFKNYTWHGAGGDDSLSPYSNASTAIESFQSLWYKINGKDSWNENPWVWVLEFKAFV